MRALRDDVWELYDWLKPRCQGRQAQLLLQRRPAARQSQMIDTGMSHIGFRCVVRKMENSSYAWMTE
jgi:hypothetical protein